MSRIEEALLKPPTDMPSSSLGHGLDTDPFSIRGYVAAVREVNIRKCWPFSLRLLDKCLEEGKDPLLPPLGGSYLSSSRDCFDLEGSFNAIRSTAPKGSTCVGTGFLGQTIELHLDLKGKLSEHTSEGEQVLLQRPKASDAEAVENEAEDETGSIYRGSNTKDTGLVVQTLGVHPGLHVDDDAKDSGAVEIKQKSNGTIENVTCEKAESGHGKGAVEIKQKSNGTIENVTCEKAESGHGKGAVEIKQKSNGTIENVTCEKAESGHGNEDLIINEEKRCRNTSNAKDEPTFCNSAGYRNLLSCKVDMQAKDGKEEVTIVYDPPREKEEGSAGDRYLAEKELPKKAEPHTDVTQDVRVPQLVVRNENIIRHLPLSLSSSPEEEDEESSEQEIYAMGKRISELQDLLAITDAQKCPICLKFQSCSNIALNAHIDHCLAIAEKTGPAAKEKRAKIAKARKKRSMAELCLVAPQCSVEGSKRRRGESYKDRSSNNILCKKRGDRLLRHGGGAGERIVESLAVKKRGLVKELQQSNAARIKKKRSSCNRSCRNGELPLDTRTKQRNEGGAGGSRRSGEVSNPSPAIVKCIDSGSSSLTKKKICFRKTELSSSNKRHKLSSRSGKYQLQNFSIKAHHSKKAERCSGVVTKGKSSMKCGRAMNLPTAQNRGKIPLTSGTATAELEANGTVSAKAAVVRIEEPPTLSPAGTSREVYRPIMNVLIPSCDDVEDEDDNDDNGACDNSGQLALLGSVGIGKEVHKQGKDGRGVLQQGCFWKESQSQLGLLPEAPCVNCNMAELQQWTCHGQRSSNGPAIATEAEHEDQCQQSPDLSILSSRVSEKFESRASPLQQVLHSDVPLLVYSGSKTRSPCLLGEDVHGTSNLEESRKKNDKAVMKELLDINATCIPDSCMDTGFHRAVVVPHLHRHHRQDQLSICKEVLGQKPGKSQRRKNLSRKMVNFFDELVHSQRSESSVMDSMPTLNLPPAQDTQREPALDFSFSAKNHVSFLSQKDTQQPAIYCGHNLTSQFQMPNLAEKSLNASSSCIGNAAAQNPSHQESPTNQSIKATDHQVPSTEHAIISRLGNPGLRLMGKTILNLGSSSTEPEMAFEKLGGHPQCGKNSNYMVPETSHEGFVMKEIYEDGSKSTMINRSTQVHNDIRLCQFTNASYNFKGLTISYGHHNICQPTHPSQSDSIWANQACYDQALPLHPPVFHKPNSFCWTGESKVLPKAPSVQAPLPPGDFHQPSSNHVWHDRSSIPASYHHIRPIQSASSVDALANAGYNVFSNSSQPPLRGPPSVTYNLAMAGTPQKSPSLYLDERNRGGARPTVSPQHFFAHCPCQNCKEANASVVLDPKSPTFQPAYPLASSSIIGKHVPQETPSWILQLNTKRQSKENIVIIEDEPPQPKLASSSFFTSSLNINKWKNQIGTDMASSVFPIGMEKSRLNVSSLSHVNHSGKGEIFFEKVAIPESVGPNQANIQHINSAVLGFHSGKNVAQGDLQKSRVLGTRNVWSIMDEALLHRGGSDWVRRDLACRTEHESSIALSENPVSNSLVQFCNTLSEILPGFSYMESIPSCLTPESGPIEMCTTNMNPAEMNIDFQDGTCFVKLPSSITSMPGSSARAKASSEIMTFKSPSLTHISRRASENEQGNEQIVYPLQRGWREDTQPFVQQWIRAGQHPTIFDSSDPRLIWSDFTKSATERCLVQNKGSAVEVESSRSGALLQCGCKTYTCQDKEKCSLKLVKITSPGAKFHIVNGRTELNPHLIAGNDQNYFFEPSSSGFLVDNICRSQISLNQANHSFPSRSSKESSVDLMKQVNPCDLITCGGITVSKEAAERSLTKRQLQNDSYRKGPAEIRTRCSVIPPHSDNTEWRHHK